MARHILKENRVFIMVMDHFYTLVILSTLVMYASGLPKSDYFFSSYFNKKQNKLINFFHFFLLSLIHLYKVDIHVRNTKVL